MNFTIGADPELFLMDRSGKYISAVGLIGGSKDMPRPILTQGFGLQEDNVAVEFNIPPSDNRETFIQNITAALHFIEAEVAEKQLLMAIHSSAHFARDQLRSPAAQNFGCIPDYNAWTFQLNPPLPTHSDSTLRTSGGHVHVGTTVSMWKAVRAMDLFQGCPSILKDPDLERRHLYGKAGACRPTDWGFEYRVLSNFWLKHTDYTAWVYDTTERALLFALETQEDDRTFLAEDQNAICETINEGNVDALAELDKKYQLL